MSRARKRSRLQIIIEILEMLSQHGELHATELSLMVKLSYDRLKSILEDLSEKGLLVLERSKNEHKSLMIKLTSDGDRLLEELRRLKRLLEDYGLV
ncbi:MAG: winged helix-turn-helix domain-containing protein [Candidatus Nezhaarchaeota archaeon]|nr:winged helix-turn-helix domain-containing protein [Candidatus Nezhaarchaeota archaeon]